MKERIIDTVVQPYIADFAQPEPLTLDTVERHCSNNGHILVPDERVRSAFNTLDYQLTAIARITADGFSFQVSENQAVLFHKGEPIATSDFYWQNEDSQPSDISKYFQLVGWLHNFMLIPYRNQYQLDLRLDIQQHDILPLIAQSTAAVADKVDAMSLEPVIDTSGALYQRNHNMMIQQKQKLEKTHSDQRGETVILKDLNVSTIDTTTSMGKLIFNINSAYAEFERDIIRDRVKAGVKAKREKNNGKWGRSTVADTIQAKIQELINQGVSVRNVAKQLDIAKGTVMKYKGA